MRERGTQVRRARLADQGQRPSPPEGTGSFWPALAIAAIIAATAGWTVVAVMALNTPETAVASATPTEDAEIVDESEEPIVLTNDVPELEALLPSQVDDVVLEKQSWRAGLYAPEEGLNDPIMGVLAEAGKTEADLEAAIASDPDFELDGVISVYRVPGVAPEAIRDAWVVDFQDAFPEFQTSVETIEGREVTVGGEQGAGAFWWAYVVDEYLFIVDGNDPELARRLLSTVSGGPAMTVPPEATPAASGS